MVLRILFFSIGVLWVDLGDPFVFARQRHVQHAQEVLQRILVGGLFYDIVRSEVKVLYFSVLHLDVACSTQVLRVDTSVVTGARIVRVLQGLVRVHLGV